MRCGNLLSRVNKILTNKFSTNKVIQRYRDQVFCDFNKLNSPQTQIECVIVKKNPLNRKLFSKCFPLCQNVVLTDGGSNHFYDTQFRESQKLRAIVGNFKTINQQVYNFYQDKGTQFVKNQDLEIKDFDKALQYCVGNKWNQLFCFGAFGGRIDRSLSCMHLSAKFGKICPDTQIVMLGKQNIMYQLKKNITYKIKISEQIFDKNGCGLITFGKVDQIETQGFKYNLGKNYDFHGLQWGQFISTSNSIQNSQCKIRSSAQVFFVARYNYHMKQ